MNFKTQSLHRVNVVYKPEGLETKSTEEVLTFLTEKAAREFAALQRKVPSVISVKYLPIK